MPLYTVDQVLQKKSETRPPVKCLPVCESRNSGEKEELSYLFVHDHKSILPIVCYLPTSPYPPSFPTIVKW